ncbi:MAG: glycoside hydrolase family 16 protein [Halobacteriovoraceae bacterium]|nr:glycoside hydrolase family 16 protein [Halobacteriovoraceae bacterium]
MKKDFTIALGALIIAISILIPAVRNDVLQKRSIATDSETAEGWSLVFADEFNGADQAISQGVDPDCFERRPTCINSIKENTLCDSGLYNLDSLKDLNKCHWSLYNHYNWMDSNAPKEFRINSFNPNMIEIKNGYLNLKARKIIKGNFDCGRELGPNDEKSEWTSHCPFLSGAITSLPNEFNIGFIQQFGRFEVRAKIPQGIGSHPAHWLLPYGGGWPGDGEIDIMEYFPDRTDRIYGTFHGELREPKIKKIQAGSFLKDPRGLKGTFFKDFHTYSVEWTPESIKWFVDDLKYYELERNQPIENNSSYKYPLLPFYFILNTTVSPMHRKKRLSPVVKEFNNLDHLIDYVRVYKKCNLEDEGCQVLNSENFKRPRCGFIHKYLGQYNAHAVCQAFPHFKIKKSKCSKKGRISWNGYCLQEKNSQQYVARKIKD